MTFRQSRQTTNQRKEGNPSWINSIRYVLGGRYRLTEAQSYLTFELPLNNSGPSLLPDSMTVNGTSVAPTLLYDSTGVRENLFSYTEDFSNGNWTTFNSSCNPNVATDPLGGQTADALVASSAGGSNEVRFRQTINGMHNGEIYTFSCYLKQGTQRYATLNPEFYGYPYPCYDLQTGTIPYVRYYETIVGGSAIVDYGIEDAGNGWYRCWISFKTNSTTGYFRIRSASTATAGNPPLDGTEHIYVWGAQVNSGPLLPYYNAAASTSGPVRKWYATVGPDLEYVGSGTDILIKHGPFLDGAPIIKFNGGKCFLSSTTVDGPGTADTAIEIITMNEITNAGTPFEWAAGAATTPRIECYTYSPSYNAPQFGGLSSTGNSLGGVRGSNRDGLLHQISFADNSELTTTGVRSYSNGGGDSYTNIGAANNLDLTFSGYVCIGARANGTSSPADEAYIRIAIYSQTDWYPGTSAANTAAYSDTIKERSAKLMGIYPTFATNYIPILASRSTNNSFMEITSGIGFRKMFQVAKGWMRVSSKKERSYNDSTKLLFNNQPFSASNIVTGIYRDYSFTEYLPYTDNLSSWTNENCSASSGYTTFDPYIQADTWALLPTDTSDKIHGVNTVVTASGIGWVSVFAKQEVKGWVSITVPTTGGGVTKYFKLTDGTTGSWVGTDYNTGGSLTDNAFTEFYGNEWYRCVFCYKNATSGTVYIRAADGDLDDLITPSNTTTPLIYLAFPNMYNSVNQGLFNYINNSTAGTLSVSSDQFAYTGSGNYYYEGEDGFTVTMDVCRHPYLYGPALFGIAIGASNSYRGPVNVAGHKAIAFYRQDLTSIVTLAGSTNYCDGNNNSIKIVGHGGNYYYSVNDVVEDTDPTSESPLNYADYIHVGDSRNSANGVAGLLSNLKIYKKAL